MFDFNLANSFGYFELVAMMGGRAFMVERGLIPASTPKNAVYNARWTLPFKRGNKIMIEVAGK